MRKNQRMYVVSEDIRLLLQIWAKQAGFKLPSDEFFCTLRRDFSEYLSSMFACVEMISEKEITDHLMKAKSCGLPCISLDTVYSHMEMSIDVTRTINHLGKDVGLRSRFGKESLSKQIATLRKKQITEACLVDDVIFSGDLMGRIITLLSHAGIEISLIYAGIGIEKGIAKIQKGHQVRCARFYSDVIDEVCERDFYLGIPFSGRSVLGEGNYGLPYILPYGQPDAWASIPKEHHKSFSRFCMLQTLKLFEEIEKVSNRTVLCIDIERKVFDQPPEGMYVDFLKQKLLSNA